MLYMFRHKMFSVVKYFQCLARTKKSQTVKNEQRDSSNGGRNSSTVGRIPTSFAATLASFWRTGQNLAGNPGFRPVHRNLDRRIPATRS